MKFMQPTATKL